MVVSYVFGKVCEIALTIWHEDHEFVTKYLSQILHPKQFLCEHCESLFSNSTNSKIHIAQEHSIRNTNWRGF